MSQGLRAMVLAAGLGTRLRPLTELLPKPAVPVVHRPVLGHLLHALAEAGVTEVMLNTHHLPDALRASVGDGALYGLRLSFNHEPEILGTGGAVRAVEAFFGDQPCLLLNGDFLIELDLREVIAAHEAARATDPRVVATMVVREDPAAERYGALGLDALDRVVDFVGRAVVPGAEVVARGLFTGVHVLEPELRGAIPEGGAPCINKTAYPAVINAGRVVRAHWQQGHWSDIGTPGGYLQANLDVLRGRVKVAGPDPRREGAIFVEEGLRMSLGGAQVVGPASVAEGALLGLGAVVGPDVVVGAGASVGAGALLRRAVVWPGAHIPPGAAHDGALIWSDGDTSHAMQVQPTQGEPGR